ncbi:MAG: GNAT family N-acetyltransferase [Actinobacteria bacterium]|nr:GNAT family N-acetyltransferase [Actinomycetota bacterium]
MGGVADAGQPAAATVRRTGPDDAERVAAFLRSVQPDNPKGDVATLRWQYWENPYGEVCSFVAESEDGRILSHCMAYPLVARYRGEPLPIAKGGDGATDADARRQGLGLKVARAAYRCAGEHGRPLTFATPNAESVRPVQRAGVDVIGRLPAYLLPLDAAWLAQRSGLPQGLAGPLGKLVFRPRRERAGEPIDLGDLDPDELDRLWESAVAAEDDRHRIVHDATWWRWRFTRPATDYRIYASRGSDGLTGLLAGVVREAFDAPVLHVVEILTPDVDTGAALVRAAVAERDAGVVAAAGIGLPGTLAAATLQRAGFRRIPERLQPRSVYLGFARNTPDQHDVSGEPWTLSWADFDHL